MQTFQQADVTQAVSLRRFGANQLSFASKVMGHVRFGFAAGCEAVAMPRRSDAFHIFGLCP